MARCIVRRLPACTWSDRLVLGPYAVTFDPDGFAIGPAGERTHPIGMAEVAQAFPAFFEVTHTDGLDDGGIVAQIAAMRGGRTITPAMLFAGLAALGPPTYESLAEAGMPEDLAREIAETEGQAADRGLFPYGARPRAAEAHQPRGEFSPITFPDSEAGPTEGATPMPAPPTELTAAPPEVPEAIPSDAEVIETVLTRLVGEHGGGNTLRAVCDSLALKGVGASKSEMAGAIRVAVSEHPECARGVAQLLGSAAKE